MMAIQYCNHPGGGHVANGTFKLPHAEVEVVLNGYPGLTLHGRKAYSEGGKFVLEGDGQVILETKIRNLDYCEEVELPVADAKTVLKTIADIID